MIIYNEKSRKMVINGLKYIKWNLNIFLFYDTYVLAL